MNKPLNVLLVGSGGREHALAWKISQSKHLAKLYVAPGNGGTAAIAENVPIKATEISALLKFAKEHAIDLTIVGPDDPLALGIVDLFTDAGLKIFGPTKDAAQIEASKAFAKKLMADQHIPTAAFEVFTDHDSALGYVRAQKLPIVVKASGLALGKGVYICATLPEAEKALQDIMLDKVFGEAGSTVVVEQFLKGQEISIHAVSDGSTAVMFPPAQDHKQIFDRDKGPNTGGMGAFAPVPWVTEELMQQIDASVVQPTLRGLKQANANFVGCLYPGLMIEDDQTMTLEFNARFGDPETQVYMPLLATDFLEMIDASINGTLSDLKVGWHPGSAACVVLASGGYPGKYETGKVITGLDEAAALPGVTLFHAGTKFEDGKYLTSGGRVLGVTAMGDSLKEAQTKAYEAVKLIHFEGIHYRTDIADKALG